MDPPAGRMTPGWLLVVAAAVSLPVGWLLARRLRVARRATLLPMDLLPGHDPILALVLRANQGLGVWVGTALGQERAAVDARLPASARELMTARLGRLAQAGGAGVERTEHGTLVFETAADLVAMILLPGPAEEGSVGAAREDLREVLGRIRLEPILATVSREQERPGESVESVAMRLAHQVERLLDAEVGVALARPQGVQVLGVSLRSDPRLLMVLAAPGSALDKVGRGIEAGPLVSDDPLGRAGSERRRARPRSVVLPIPGPDLTVGAVVVSTPDGVLPAGSATGQLFQALQAAGPRLARALDRQELQETSLSDPLTGLRNRRGLELALRRIEHAAGVLIVADIDRFKSLNDTLGHAAGDAALVHFARVMGQAVRSGDVVARTGGEEFAIWLPDTALAEGIAAAERIRSGLEALDWAWQGKGWPLTASFGVAGCPQTVPGVEHLAARADDALYQAKQGGRNRVVVAAG
jgi:diguanylate cyclase (GGDEF)-like protein